jgi:hypothetical protein
MDAPTPVTEQLPATSRGMGPRKATATVLWVALYASGVLEPVLFALLAVRLAGFWFHQSLRRWRYRPGGEK